LEYKFESQKAILFLTLGTITLIGFLGYMFSQEFYTFATVMGTLIFIILHRKEDDSIHRILFSVIVLQIVVGLVLTPLWVTNLYGIPFWPQLPIRIIKTPIEIFIYSVLLIRIVKVLQLYLFPDK